MALRCLLVDDDAHFLESAMTLLQREGLQVDTASSGAQAAQRIGELRPDLVLLDIRLGEESGFTVARELHAAWPTEGPPGDAPKIILISTYSETDFGRLVEASPALGFIAKSSLSARAIRELIEGRASGP
ncbi:MAG TPA: response regulator [Pseudonocardia sp.]|jgi:CheY-like chemotaxis protein|uniref:response regulator n=1 Tax=Pseudonocardia sp. TaxID=60912 RepID=UPI002B9F3FE5|nr:response regulator [Pseudonocardia sp.]HTF49666.1 response regulator [Pseudonocardia sp.]